MPTPRTSQSANPVGAVLFDLDGTLVTTHIDFGEMRAGVVAAAAEAGIAPEEVHGLDILSTAQRAAAILREREGEEAAREFALRAQEAMMAAEVRGLEGAGPAPYAGEVLRTLTERGIRIGIVTRNCRRVTDTVLAMSELACPVILTRDDVERCKPDPAHLLEALERLQVPPEAAVMVGDHTMDVQAGRAAGMRTVGVLDVGRPADFFDAVSPDCVVTDLRGVLAFVDGAP